MNFAFLINCFVFGFSFIVSNKMFFRPKNWVEEKRDSRTQYFDV